MDIFLSFLSAFGGVVAGALAIKLYTDWQIRKQDKEFKQWMDEEFSALEELCKPPVSDPEEPPGQPL